MKTTMKRIIAIILCTVIAIASAGASTVYASKKLPLKASFNGKSVTLSKDLTANDRETVEIKTVENKWGKPNKDDDGMRYTWKKGKTSFEIRNDNGYVGSISININDKNGALYGVKVGMKIETALKKLKKNTGIKNVKSISPDDYQWMDEVGIYSSEETIEVNPATYMPICFHVKNGKVSSISWFRS